MVENRDGWAELSAKANAISDFSILKAKKIRLKDVTPLKLDHSNIREYARIQTFPDSWKFAGSKSSRNTNK